MIYLEYIAHLYHHNSIGITITEALYIFYYSYCHAVINMKNKSLPEYTLEEAKSVTLEKFGDIDILDVYYTEILFPSEEEKV